MEPCGADALQLVGAPEQRCHQGAPRLTPGPIWGPLLVSFNDRAKRAPQGRRLPK